MYSHLTDDEIDLEIKRLKELADKLDESPSTKSKSYFIKSDWALELRSKIDLLEITKYRRLKEHKPYRIINEPPQAPY